MTDPEAELQKLTAETPPKRASGQGVVAKGDWPQAARLYAKSAVNNGRDENWWAAWLAIQRFRGLSTTAALDDDLGDQGLRWLALWSFNHAQPDIGIEAYERFLAAQTKRAGPFHREH